VTRSDLAIKLWLKCWVVMAKMMAMVFKDSFTKEEYSELRECLCNERVLLSQKWVLRRNVEMPLLVNINEELKLAYEDFRDNSAIPNSMPLFFEYASFIFENERDNTILRRLRIGMLYQSISKMEAILQL
ncbi:11779_t:CDS:2, partial [Rhizophagus irregularis]